MSLKIHLSPHKNPRIDALSDAKRLRWVFEFIQRDLEALPSKVLETLGDDLRHATAPGWVHERYCTDMSAAQVRALQQDIREGVYAAMGASIDFKEFMDIHRGHPPPPMGMVLPEPATHILRIRLDPCGHHVRLMSVSEGMTDRTAILTGVANLILTFGDRLCTCPVCGTPFLRQYRQAYCTVRCSNKVRNRRRLDRQAEQRVNKKRGAASLIDTPSATTA